MLDSCSQKIIDDCLINISKQLPGYKVRPGQLQMIKQVAETLSRSLPFDSDIANTLPERQGESILVVEGPTGIGKSLGYLLPAIVIAQAFKKKLIVSSATVALQEQLANKDIPFVVQHSGLKLTYVIAKGRSRYVCPSRLFQYSLSVDQPDLFRTSPTTATERTEYMQFLIAQLEQQWSGDRDKLPRSIPDELWSQVTNDRHGCTNRRCEYFSKCPFYKARATLENTDIIIVNHDLLLADIAMGAGTILPHPSESFYCLDEAHHFADKGVQQFAASHTILGTLAWLERAPQVTARARMVLKDHPAIQSIPELTELLAGNLQTLHSILGNFAELKPQRITHSLPVCYRCEQGKLPEVLCELRDDLLKHVQMLLTAMSLLQDALLRKKSASPKEDKSFVLEKILSDLGFLYSRTENMAAVWELYGETTSANEMPIAKWFTGQLTKNNQMEYGIYAARVRVGQLLVKHFWRYAAGAILTSATLRSLGNFDLLLTETGLNTMTRTSCLALPSPFNLSQQGYLSVPPMQTDPKDPQRHTFELIKLMPLLIKINEGEGTLVLFSSRKQMLEVASALPRQLQDFLLMQGEQSKEKLIQQHFACIQNKQASILFGLASFAEGLDLPGKACTHVIIAKLPFTMPEEPIAQTLAEWIEKRGGNAFQEITLPLTSIRLIQAVGRLIRSETDTGKITILDTRLKTKSYGRSLLKTLPPFQLI